ALIRSRSLAREQLPDSQSSLVQSPRPLAGNSAASVTGSAGPVQFLRMAASSFSSAGTHRCRSERKVARHEISVTHWIRFFRQRAALRAEFDHPMYLSYRFWQHGSAIET